MLDLVSEIPDESPVKPDVEASVHGVFDALDGRWTVRIRRAQPWTHWWGFVEIEGPKGFSRFFVVERPEQVSELTAGDRELLQAVSRLEARSSFKGDSARWAGWPVPGAVPRATPHRLGPT